MKVKKTLWINFCIYYSSKKLSQKIHDYGWKYGRNGWTTLALNLRCRRPFWDIAVFFL